MVDAEMKVVVECEMEQESQGLLQPSRRKQCLANSCRRCFSGVAASIALVAVAGLGLHSVSYVEEHDLFNQSALISAQRDSPFVSECKKQFKLLKVTPKNFGRTDKDAEALRKCFYCDKNVPADVSRNCDKVNELADQTFASIKGTKTWSLWTGGSVIPVWLGDRTVTLESTSLVKLLDAMAPQSLAKHLPKEDTRWWNCSQTVWHQLSARYAAQICKNVNVVDVWISTNSLRDLAKTALISAELPRLAAQRDFCEKGPDLKLHFLRCDKDKMTCHEKCHKDVTIKNNRNLQSMTASVTAAVEENKNMKC